MGNGKASAHLTNAPTPLEWMRCSYPVGGRLDGFIFSRMFWYFLTPGIFLQPQLDTVQGFPIPARGLILSP